MYTVLDGLQKYHFMHHLRYTVKMKSTNRSRVPQILLLIRGKTVNFGPERFLIR